MHDIYSMRIGMHWLKIGRTNYRLGRPDKGNATKLLLSTVHGI